MRHWKCSLPFEECIVYNTCIFANLETGIVASRAYSTIMGFVVWSAYSHAKVKNSWLQASNGRNLTCSAVSNTWWLLHHQLTEGGMTLKYFYRLQILQFLQIVGSDLRGRSLHLRWHFCKQAIGELPNRTKCYQFTSQWWTSWRMSSVPSKQSWKFLRRGLSTPFDDGSRESRSPFINL